MILEKLRKQFHRKICQELLFAGSDGVPNNADKHSEISVALAKGIVREIGFRLSRTKSKGQTAGKVFESLTKEFLEESFTHLAHLRPGRWHFSIGQRIEDFEQYEHLATLAKAISTNMELRSILGDYLINPDIVVGRSPLKDSEINRGKRIISSTENVASLTPMRQKNNEKPLLHASISCKWTIRSDRSQNARTEGLNLIRNRKGRTPHIVIVTAEPYPQRIASIALGTGDIDCVYHFALTELLAAVESLRDESVNEMVRMLVTGKRLRDISDLPLDLAQ